MWSRAARTLYIYFVLSLLFRLSLVLLFAFLFFVLSSTVPDLFGAPFSMFFLLFSPAPDLHEYSFFLVFYASPNVPDLFGAPFPLFSLCFSLMSRISLVLLFSLFSIYFFLPVPGLVGASWGPLGDLMGASWEPLGGLLGASWGALAGGSWRGLLGDS